MTPPPRKAIMKLFAVEVRAAFVVLCDHHADVGAEK